VVPWAQSVISKWTGFSRIAAAVLLPRRLLARDGLKQKPAPSGRCAGFKTSSNFLERVRGGDRWT
jgi:hypothetical protein